MNAKTYTVSIATRTADDLVTCREAGRFTSIRDAMNAAKRLAGAASTFDAAGMRYVGAAATAYIA